MYGPSAARAFVHVAAILSLSGGYLATSTAESSRLLSLPDGKEIKFGWPRLSRGLRFIALGFVLL